MNRRTLTIRNPVAPDIPAPFRPTMGIRIELNAILIIVPQTVVVNSPLVCFATRYVVPKKADIFEKMAVTSKIGTIFHAEKN